MPPLILVIASVHMDRIVETRPD